MERDTTLGLFIRAERLRKGLTIASAAALAGVSRKYWTELEGGANVTIAVLRKAAAVLDLTSIPIGQGVSINRAGAIIDAGAVLGLTESLAAKARDAELLIDQLRDLALTAMMKTDPLLETESVRNLFAGHPEPNEEEAASLARVAQRLSKDAAQPVPALEPSPVPAVVKKRRKA